MKSVHEALCAWGDWVILSSHENLRCEIGYSSITIIGKMVAGIPVGTGNKAKRQGASIVPVSLLCDAGMGYISRVVSELPDGLREAVIAKYLGEGDSDSARVGFYCQLKGMSRSTFDRKLTRAHGWLKRRGVGRNHTSAKRN